MVIFVWCLWVETEKFHLQLYVGNKALWKSLTKYCLNFRTLKWWLHLPCTHIGMPSYWLCHWVFEKSKFKWHFVSDADHLNTCGFRKEGYVYLELLVMIFLWCFCELKHKYSVHNCVLATRQTKITKKCSAWSSDARKCWNVFCFLK